MKNLLVIALLLLPASCSQPDHRQKLLDDLADRMADSFEVESAELRYNPSSCDCPPFEVNSGGTWVRITFGDNNPPAEAVALLEQARRDLDEGDLPTYRRRLELDSSSPRFCQNGTPYFEVELQDD